MMASGASYQVLDCGYLRPLGMDSCPELTAGEVGWFTASIKTVSDTRVGDTITEVDRPAAEALPGYRPAQAMVYCGIYTEDGSKYPDLRDALEKLQLNDASLSFEPESSIALGFGFRCGFLGMLHMEIIQERLEREFDLDLVTTLPSVIYEVTKTDGTVVRVDNPHNYPDPGQIAEAREPYAKVSIISPPDYVGNIMPMCQERRGIFKDMQYLDTNLVELHYLHAPGGDHLRLLRRPEGPHQGVRLPGLRAGGLSAQRAGEGGPAPERGPGDALSFIAHRDKALPPGPAHLREAQGEHPPPALRGAHPGGHRRQDHRPGDRQGHAQGRAGQVLRRRHHPRKKKLLEKQKEGKKKMRTLGTVQLPTEAFMAVLKLDEE